MSDKTTLENARTSPVVDIPALNKLKRKHSLGPASPPRTQPLKKQRPGDVASPSLPSANIRQPIKQEGYEQTTAPEFESQTPFEVLPINAAVQAMRTDFKNASTDKSMFCPAPSVGQGQPDLSSATSDVQLDAAPLQPSVETAPMSSLQQVIENEFNMQILMKHNELRLIEQELAKCQIALEQLRRCELRPFPGDQQPSENVSAGTGPAVAPAPGLAKPSHAAPHGVTDGPYSRHYSHWLLRDQQFDATPLHSPLYSEAYSPVPARPTRNTASARKSVSKSFAFPGRPGEPLHSIPNYPAPAEKKEKGAPQILRRSTDGQLVKLICNNCHRGNFSSIQGFLNHCRIAHKVDYKSHDAAAIDCGQLLDEHEAANVPPETHNAPAHKPSVSKSAVSRAPSAQSTPARNFSHYVHPLNTTAGATAPLSHSRQNSTASRKPLPKLDSANSSLATSPLTPSPHIPHLSAFFAKHQLGGDLAKAAAIAKQRVEFGADEDLNSPDLEQRSPLEFGTAGSKGVAGRTAMPESAGDAKRPPSRKGYRQLAQAHRPRPSPLAPAPPPSLLKEESMDFLSSPQDHTSITLSPHTADSNPGLVSDHEDDDHSDSGEDAPQEEIARPPPLNVGARNCSDNMEIDVAVEDDVGRDGVVIRRNSLLMDDDRALRGPGSPSRKLGGGRRA